MRLLDNLASLRKPLVEFRGQAMESPCAVEMKAALEQCYLRYVLGDDVSACCISLARESADFLAATADIVRMPAPIIWVEWNDGLRTRDVDIGPGCAPQARRRTAMCVLSEADGRRGRILCCWEFPEDPERIEFGPMEIQFNLDDPDYALTARRADHRLALSFPELPGLSRVLQHASFQLAEPYARLLSLLPPERFQNVCTPVAARVAMDFPILLSFLLLLAAPNTVSVNPSDLDRLNAARARRGKPALLSHMEVRWAIGAEFAKAMGGGGGGDRSGPRAHFVRGHLVRRQDKVFWRRGHVRGQLNKGLICSRTTSVSLARGIAARPEQSIASANSNKARTVRLQAPSPHPEINLLEIGEELARASGE